MQQSDENVCNDDGFPMQSYRHSTFRPYPVPQDDENSFRSCRSHESLLAYATATHAIDLGLRFFFWIYKIHILLTYLSFLFLTYISSAFKMKYWNLFSFIFFFLLIAVNYFKIFNAKRSTFFLCLFLLRRISRFKWS